MRSYGVLKPFVQARNISSRDAREEYVRRLQKIQRLVIIQANKIIVLVEIVGASIIYIYHYIRRVSITARYLWTHYDENILTFFTRVKISLKSTQNSPIFAWDNGVTWSFSLTVTFPVSIAVSESALYFPCGSCAAALRCLQSRFLDRSSMRVSDTWVSFASIRLK
jgi:hypothetical protein